MRIFIIGVIRLPSQQEIQEIVRRPGKTQNGRPDHPFFFFLHVFCMTNILKYITQV